MTIRQSSKMDHVRVKCCRSLPSECLPSRKKPASPKLQATYHHVHNRPVLQKRSTGREPLPTRKRREKAMAIHISQRKVETVHTSNRGYSQQPAGNQDYSCSQTQPRNRSYSHHQAQYRNEKRVSSQASKMYILRQKSTKLNKMPSALQTEECNNRRESAPSPVQQQFPRRRVVMVAHPTDLNTNQDREHQPLKLLVRRTGRQQIYKEGNEPRGRRIGVCYETDETKEHRMFVRVLRKRF